MNDARENPKAPHNQVFNVGAKPNKSKTNSWWNPGSDKFWRKAKIDKRMVK